MSGSSLSVQLHHTLFPLFHWPLPYGWKLCINYTRFACLLFCFARACVRVCVCVCVCKLVHWKCDGSITISEGGWYQEDFMVMVMYLMCSLQCEFMPVCQYWVTWSHVCIAYATSQQIQMHNNIQYNNAYTSKHNTWINDHESRCFASAAGPARQYQVIN